MFSLKMTYNFINVVKMIYLNTWRSENLINIFVLIINFVHFLLIIFNSTLKARIVYFRLP